ncbi:unnamed protein product [Hermetia illucens]|uniref:LisH domain-containing protein n=1 Tax=Hermetia illucens TaxID=343691 RepID=A0A7R8Z2P1_HERIL|nr:uncharacterized protein LOC119659612 [Hermetia illucens]CAD7093816.1 unnamed protein product [Hermetia illucens]
MDKFEATPRRERELQLANVIRQVMERNTQIDKLKIMIQNKTLKQLQSDGAQNLISRKRPSPEDRSPAAIIYAVHELIMEYFHWFGYQYSAEMFSLESGCDPACPERAYLESKLGEHDKDTPILVEEVFNLIRNKTSKSSPAAGEPSA